MSGLAPGILVSGVGGTPQTPEVSNFRWLRDRKIGSGILSSSGGLAPAGLVSGVGGTPQVSSFR